ncbi:MAG: sulfatase activating formylglycine-generating enzyme, partial [Planctomycetota bacterium]
FIQSVLEQRTHEARQEATQARSVAIEKGFSREHETFVSGQDHYDSAQNHADEEQYEDSIRAFVRATIAFKALKKLDPEVLARRPIEFTVGVTEQDRKLALQVCNQANGDCAKLNFSRETARNVSIAPFGIDQNEISNIQFAQFVKETRYLTQAERQGFTFGLESGALIKVAGLNWRQPLQGVEVSVQEIPNHPVVNLTRVEAQAYCEWDKKRLPSEEEWEFVARGVDQRRLYSWGNGWQQASTEAEFALGVGSNPADMTPERVFDLSGNVKEWTSSNDGDSAIVRGGSWIDNGINRSRLSFRHTVSSELPMQDVGFRCAKTIEKWGGTGS